MTDLVNDITASVHKPVVADPPHKLRKARSFNRLLFQHFSLIATILNSRSLVSPGNALLPRLCLGCATNSSLAILF